VHRSILLLSISALISVGCGGGGAAAGGACSASKPCPDGQACDLTNPDGDPICVDGNDDEDGDGIPNEQDFCMHMAGGAFDEDGDGIGDDCDACPIARPPATPETDNDGVDAPCDPDPRLGGAKIVLFEGFNAALSDKWKPTGAAWTVKDGAVSIVAGAAEDIQIPILPSNKLEVFTDYRVSAANANTAQIGVKAVNQLPMGNTRVLCGASRELGKDNIVLFTQTENNNHTSKSNLFDTSTRYGLLQQIDVGAANCAYSSTAASDPISGNTNGEAMNQVGMHVQGATASFSYILVVEH
jgi:hypothetical protein